MLSIYPPQDELYPASIALIDLRSGRLAYSNPWLALDAGSGFDMSLHPESQIIDVGIGAPEFAIYGYIGTTPTAADLQI